MIFLVSSAPACFLVYFFANLNLNHVGICPPFFWEVVCVCFSLVVFCLAAPCPSLSRAAVAGRPTAVVCRCRLSLSFCRCCFAVFVCRGCFCRCPLSSWSVRPRLVLVPGRCRCRRRGPRTLDFVTYDLPSLAKAIKRPLRHEYAREAL